MYEVKIVATTDFRDGYVAIVIRDTYKLGEYGVEFLQGSVKSSKAGLTAREAFLAYALLLLQLHDKNVKLS